MPKTPTLPSTDPGSFASVRLLVVQHDERNGPGIISGLSCETVVHRSDLQPVLPDVRDFDGLIVLGGPMASYSDEGFASRLNEIALLTDAVRFGVPVLGICLGAQLLARALGANTYKREVPEIGYLPVRLTLDGRKDPLFDHCPKVFAPRHKHYDSFELPEGAVRLASSELCREQGYRYGELAWGVQFHFEMDPEANQDERVAEPLSQLAPVAQRILSNFCTIVARRVVQEAPKVS